MATTWPTTRGGMSVSYRRVILPDLVIPTAQEGTSVPLAEETIHYLFRVLRVPDGSWIEVCNGTHQSWLARVVKTSPHEASLQDWKPCTHSLSLFPVYLAQAMPKGDKWEHILQKGTELGVSGFFPFFSSRCVIRPKPEKDSERTIRWQRIVQEASRQCQRSDVPHVASPVSWEELPLRLPPGLPRLVCWEEEHQQSLHDWFTTQATPPGIVIAVGPEGGFSAQEIVFFQQHQFVAAGLGSLILRTETAGPFVAGLFQYKYGILGHPASAVNLHESGST